MPRLNAGQAALEFLTTYGWAFLVILVMIGALAYFGVLNPSGFLPDKCLFGTGIGGCVDSGVVPGGDLISGIIINNYGADIDPGADFVFSISGSSCVSYAAGTWIGNAGPDVDPYDFDADPQQVVETSSTWPSGERLTFGIACADGSGFPPGERPKITVRISDIRLPGSNYPKSNEGVLQVKVPE